MFPYQIQNGGQHYTLWFPSLLQEISEQDINQIIQDGIKQLVLSQKHSDINVDVNLKSKGNSTCNTKEEGEESFNVKDPEIKFDYAWFINPKMTVPEFFHVQVFFVIFPI